MLLRIATPPESRQRIYTDLPPDPLGLPALVLRCRTKARIKKAVEPAAERQWKVEERHVASAVNGRLRNGM